MVRPGLTVSPSGGDDLAGVAHLERAGAGIGGGAVGLLDLEEALALDGDVERVVGLQEIALLGDAVDRRRL